MSNPRKLDMTSFKGASGEIQIETSRVCTSLGISRVQDLEMIRAERKKTVYPRVTSKKASFL